MGANSKMVLHVDAWNYPVYDSADLECFQHVLNDILGDYESLGSLSNNEKAYLKAQLAIAIFKSADSGERDYTQLKQSAIEAVSAVPPLI
jgi:hypothetical protein